MPDVGRAAHAGAVVSRSPIFAVPVALLACRGPDASAPPPSHAPPVEVTQVMTGAVALPGPCVPVPRREFVVSRVMRQSSPVDHEYPAESSDNVGMSTHATLDVDGDGVQDMAVPEPVAQDCPTDGHYGLYVMRGECGHHVGTLVGRIDPKGDAKAGAGRLPELTTTVEYGEQPDPREPAVLRTDRRTYRFEGAAYREVSRTSSSAVCHHCGQVSCRVLGVEPTPAPASPVVAPAPASVTREPAAITTAAIPAADRLAPCEVELELTHLAPDDVTWQTRRLKVRTLVREWEKARREVDFLREKAGAVIAPIPLTLEQASVMIPDVRIQRSGGRVLVTATVGESELAYHFDAQGRTDRVDWDPQADSAGYVFFYRYRCAAGAKRPVYAK